MNILRTKCAIDLIQESRPDAAPDTPAPPPELVADLVSSPSSISSWSPTSPVLDMDSAPSHLLWTPGCNPTTPTSPSSLLWTPTSSDRWTSPTPLLLPDTATNTCERLDLVDAVSSPSSSVNSMESKKRPSSRTELGPIPHSSRTEVTRVPCTKKARKNPRVKYASEVKRPREPFQHAISCLLVHWAHEHLPDPYVIHSLLGCS